ncbi:MAG: helix-turn-helix domain-containing protein [Oscillospiraceae bacterium]|nr:helix-turn-helix domain-containing protein [Oscillospiraceae bacterium]
MQLDLGSNIRQLRRKNKRTQEALAEALGVTSQAVSRWESGGSYPDMNLIPSIANYFGISIDELFGYTNKRTERIDELVALIYDMKRQNNGLDYNINECISTARNALLEFPGNEKLMLALASVLYTAGGVRYGECHLVDEEGYGVYDTEKHRTYEEWREAVPLYEKALESLPNGALRNRAVDELSQLYLNLGEYEKGMALADSAPDMWNSREFLRAYACSGKQFVKAHSETLLETIRASAVFIVNITTGDQQHLSAKEKADNIASAIGLFALVCPDGNYGCHHGYIASLEMLHSLYLWLDGQKDAAFAALERARENGMKLIRICEDGTAHYTAPLVRLAEEKAYCNADEARQDYRTMPEDWPWWSVPEAEQVKAEMQADPRWDVWAAKTQL